MADHELRARLTLHTSQFDAAAGQAAGRLKALLDAPQKAAPGLRAFNEQVQRLAPTLTAVGNAATLMGGAIVAGFAVGLKSAADFMEGLELAAGALGETTEKTQALQQVLAASGINFQQFQAAASGVVDKLAQAREGNQAAAAAFKRLGIDANDAQVRNLGAADAFALVAERLNGVTDAQERLALARDLGISARALRILGTGDFGAQVDAAMQGPLILTKQQQEQLSELDAAFDSLGVTAQRVKDKAFAELAPALVPFLNVVTDLLETLADWINTNPELARSIMVGVGAFGLLAIGGGRVIAGIAPLVQIVTNLSGLLTMLGGAGGAAGAGLGAAGAAGGVASAGGLAALVTTLGTLALVAGTAAAALVAVYEIAKIIAAIKVTAGVEAGTEEKRLRYNKSLVELEEEGRLRPGAAERMAQPWMTNFFGAAGDVARYVPGGAPAAGILHGVQGYLNRRYQRWYESSPQDEVIPRMAAGGIVTRSTFANIGEAGPEAILPLDRLPDMIAQALQRVSLGGLLAGAAGQAYGLVQQARYATQYTAQPVVVPVAVNVLDVDGLRRQLAQEARTMGRRLGARHARW